MDGKGEFTGDFPQDCLHAEQTLHTDRSTDMVERRLLLAGREMALYYADGLIKDEVMEKMLEFLMKLTPNDVPAGMSVVEFDRKFVTYVEVGRQKTLRAFGLDVAMGRIGLVIAGFDEAILIEAREYPVRSVEEPEDDRVLRGPHDGFVETALFNTAQLRRRIRDPQLINEALTVGTTSHTDVFLCYLDGVCPEKLIKKARDMLQKIDLPTLCMAQEGLNETLARGQWYNPFPKVRFTERPDAACAAIAEGRLVLIVDNSPAAIILPTSVFDFTQDTNDYYFPPMVGSYLRLVRNIVFLTTLILTPLWYLLIRHPEAAPDWLSFALIREPNKVPIIVQLLIAELIVDGLKLASLNTPNALSNAFGLIGGLILGEFAVNVDLFVEQVLLCMAFVAVANFTQPNFELGYAFKLFRLLLLVLIALLDGWGLLLGLAIMLVLLVTTRTPVGHNYLYPLIPFNGDALHRLLLRRPVHRDNC